MFWTIIFYLFLIIVFLVFLKLSTLKVNGRQVLSGPTRFVIALIFPLILVLVALFSSMLLLFVMALLLISLLVFFILFLLGRIKILYRKPKVNSPVVIHSVRKKRKKRKK